jgi:trans-aconitate 2-methyltransferase
MSGGNDWDGAGYDRVATPQANWGREVLVRLELAGGETVLDAGCGSGRVTEHLLGRLPSGHVVALDASPSMLRQARSRLAPFGDRASFVEADLSAVTGADLGGRAPVDAVFSTATFHWVTDHDRLFANLLALMAPGAQLVAQCGGEGNIAGVVAAVRSLGTDRAGTWLYASAAATRARLEMAGFVDVRTRCHEQPVPFARREDLVEFLQTVCLREHLGTLSSSERLPFTERVVDAMPAPVIDYVRLEIDARRP